MQAGVAQSNGVSGQGSAVFTKTARGRHEVAQRSPGLNTRQRQVLILVDGVKQLSAINRMLPVAEFNGIIDFLQQQDMIAPHSAPSADLVAHGAATPPGASLVTDPAHIAALQDLLSDTARQFLGLLSADICRRIAQAQDASGLLAVLGQWHMALRQSKHGGVYAGQSLQLIEASLYGAAVPGMPATPLSKV